MQIEFADRAARILLFRQRIERKGGVGGWIGGVLVVGVVEGCLGEHRLYRVRSVWIARRSRRERGAIVRDTEGSKVDTHPPFTASTHPYTIIRRPPARSFFRRRVANQGLDFSLPRLLPPFSLASIANQVRKCARARDAPRPERRAEYLRSLSSYLVLSPCSHRIGMTCSAHKVFLGGDPFRNWVTAATWSR